MRKILQGVLEGEGKPEANYCGFSSRKIAMQPALIATAGTRPERLGVGVMVTRSMGSAR